MASPQPGCPHWPLPPTAPTYTITDLGALGGVDSAAWAINAAGQIIGESTVDPTYPKPEHAFLWEKGQMKDLGALGMGDSWAYGINAAGQVVGWSKTDSSQIHASMWENGSMTDLGTLGGKYSGATGINNAGVVCGTADTASSASRACVWENGVIKDLGSAGTAWSVNAAGQAVGELGSRAGLWQNGQVINLQDLLPADSGWKLQAAWSINDAGQTVGLGTHNGQTHAFLMSPQQMREFGGRPLSLPPVLRIASLGGPGAASPRPFSLGD